MRAAIWAWQGRTQEVPLAFNVITRRQIKDGSNYILYLTLYKQILAEIDFSHMYYFTLTKLNNIIIFITGKLKIKKGKKKERRNTRKNTTSNLGLH